MDKQAIDCSKLLLADLFNSPPINLVMFEKHRHILSVTVGLRK